MVVREREFIAHDCHAAIGADGRPDAGLEPERDVAIGSLFAVVTADEVPQLGIIER